jgi:hypothetical protein
MELSESTPAVVERRIQNPHENDISSIFWDFKIAANHP